MSIKEDITAFLGQEQIAVAGVSRNSKKFSNLIYLALKKAGHRMHPINPNAQSLEGDECVSDVRSLPEVVSTLLIVARPQVSLQVLRDAVDCGIPRIWVHPGSSAELKAEIDRARSSGLTVISGLCPMMFIDPVGFPHTTHRFFMRLFGTYPK